MRRCEQSSFTLLLAQPFPCFQKQVRCSLAKNSLLCRTREFIGNYLILRLIPSSVSSPKAQKRRNSLFFSLLAGNSNDRDRFRGTTSTTKKSVETTVVAP